MIYLLKQLRGNFASVFLPGSSLQLRLKTKNKYLVKIENSRHILKCSSSAEKYWNSDANSQDIFSRYFIEIWKLVWQSFCCKNSAIQAGQKSVAHFGWNFSGKIHSCSLYVSVKSAEKFLQIRVTLKLAEVPGLFQELDRFHLMQMHNKHVDVLILAIILKN